MLLLSSLNNIVISWFIVFFIDKLRHWSSTSVRYSWLTKVCLH